jgi:hypothetical protein
VFSDTCWHRPLSLMASNLEEWLRHEGRGLRAVAAGRSTDVTTHHRLMGLISFLYFVPVDLVRTE